MSCVCKNGIWSFGLDHECVLEDWSLNKKKVAPESATFLYGYL